MASLVCGGKGGKGNPPPAFPLPVITTSLPQGQWTNVLDIAGLGAGDPSIIGVRLTVTAPAAANGGLPDAVVQFKRYNPPPDAPYEGSFQGSLDLNVRPADGAVKIDLRVDTGSATIQVDWFTVP